MKTLFRGQSAERNHKIECGVSGRPLMHSIDNKGAVNVPSGTP